MLSSHLCRREWLRWISTDLECVCWFYVFPSPSPTGIYCSEQAKAKRLAWRWLQIKTVFHMLLTSMLVLQELCLACKSSMSLASSEEILCSWMKSSLWWLMKFPQVSSCLWAHTKVPSSTNHQCNISTFHDQTLLSWPFCVISLDRHTLVFSKHWINPAHSDFPCLCSQMLTSLVALQ